MDYSNNNLSMLTRVGFLTLLLVFLLPGSVNADMLVKAVNGDNLHLITAQGEMVENIQPLSILKAGDRLWVDGKDDYVDILDNDRKVVRIDTNNSPYRVPDVSSTTWLDNALQATLDWYHKLEKPQTQTLTLISRGEDSTSISLHGMNPDANLILTDRPEITVLWSGDIGPYVVKVFAEDGKLLIEKEVSSNQTAISLIGLQEGAYLLQVVSKVNPVLFADEQMFTIVDDALLPEEVRAQTSKVADPSLSDQLKAIMLANYPEWKFYALQLANAQGNAKLFAYITGAD
ncbi:MAG: hypothetical protein AB2687_03510 [Candidatus Thiodiazotropha taylori]